MGRRIGTSTTETQPRTVVLLTYSDLGEGETRAGESCPACNDPRGTFSVSRRDGILLWTCHRNACDFRGASAGGRAGPPKDHAAASTRGFVGRRILHEASRLPEQIARTLLERYAITEVHIAKWHIGWDEGTSRVVLPVLDQRGEARGCVLRATTSVHPKTLTHTEQGAIAWFTNVRASGIIIVEDQLSAIRASDYLTSVALLGTHLNDERVEELRAAKRGLIWLALDNDAIGTAIKHVVKYRSILPIQLVRLTKDIKDMTHEEADALFASLGASRM